MKLLVLVLGGAIIGIIVASLIVPPALSWYTAPGGLPEGTQIQALVQIPDVIRYATGRLLRGQLIGATVGGLLGLGIGVLLMRKDRLTPPTNLEPRSTGVETTIQP